MFSVYFLRSTLIDDMMSSARVVEKSISTADNSPSQDYAYLDDYTRNSNVTPGFKPPTV